MALRLSFQQGRLFVSAGGRASSAFLHSSLGSNTFSAKRSTEPTKQPLKKPVTPVGRFDTPEESNVEKELLEKFPDDINPTTKEKGGPKGWETGNEKDAALIFNSFLGGITFE